MGVIKFGKKANEGYHLHRKSNMKNSIVLISMFLTSFISYTQATNPHANVQATWSVASTTVKGNTLTMTFNTDIPTGWVLQTEVPSSIGIPLKMTTEQQSLIDTIIITHQITDEVSNKALLMDETASGKFVAEKTSFTFKIIFKTNIIPSVVKGEIIYWLNNKEEALYPLIYAFAIKTK